MAGAESNTTTTRVKTLKNEKPTSGNFSSYTYGYDALGNITSISGSTTATYTYDALSQLTGAVQDGVSYSYSYNKAGNLTSKTCGGVTDSYTYGNSEWRDLLTKYNGHTISYDTIGNPTSYYDGTAFTWTHGRQLATAVNSGTGLDNSYTYDADGLRLTKTVDGVVHKYLWQGGKLVSESWNGNVLEFFYGPDGSPEILYYLASGGTAYNRYFFVKNLQGDVTALINKNGVVKAEYTYAPYGKVLSATGVMADINPIRYRGYYYDTDTGFYYIKSRYYDPNTCRFLNADGLASTGQGFLGTNMFAYCNNNPVNGYDPSGRWMWYLDSNGNGNEEQHRKKIKYDVPLYFQGDTNLCWAYSEIMILSYRCGRFFSQEEADAAAWFLAIAAMDYEETDWNVGRLPIDRGQRIDGKGLTLEKLYYIVLDYGPAYAIYENTYDPNNPKYYAGHCVVVVGVDLDNGTVFTNNPQGNIGNQTFAMFMSGYAKKTGQSSDRYMKCIYTVN